MSLLGADGAAGCETPVALRENRGIDLWILSNGIAPGGIAAAGTTLDKFMRPENTLSAACVCGTLRRAGMS
jgi:hypothetical protein